MNSNDEPRDVPNLLYHYTSFEGVKGILETNYLLATEVSFLNDSSEPTYGRDQIETLIRKIENEAVPLQGLSISEAILNRSEIPYLRFVISFCDDDDLLSMWRNYAELGGGLALGFQSDRLKDLESQGYSKLVKIEYGEPDLARPEFGPVIEFAQELSRRETNQGIALDVIRFFEIARTLDDQALRIKHRGFHEEKEWRLLTFIDKEDIDRKQLIANGKKLQMKLELKHPFTRKREKLPISRIVVGPNARQQQMVELVRVLLARADYENDVQVDASEIPVI